jgi:hypothetical protein
MIGGEKNFKSGEMNSLGQQDNIKFCQQLEKLETKSYTCLESVWQTISQFNVPEWHQGFKDHHELL